MKFDEKLHFSFQKPQTMSKANNTINERGISFNSLIYFTVNFPKPISRQLNF